MRLKYDVLQSFNIDHYHSKRGPYVILVFTFTTHKIENTSELLRRKQNLFFIIATSAEKKLQLYQRSPDYSTADNLQHSQRRKHYRRRRGRWELHSNNLFWDICAYSFQHTLLAFPRTRSIRRETKLSGKSNEVTQHRYWKKIVSLSDFLSVGQFECVMEDNQ